jgi:arsenate reductase (glutaredoxin)
MPAPLGKTPTKKMPKIDVLGTEDSPSTRSAIRFFRSRRIAVSFVDLRKKPMTPAELRSALDRLGSSALDTDALAPEDAAELATDRGKLIARIHADARVLRLPLVRYGDAITAGQDEAAWRGWLARRSGTGR